MSTDVDTTEDSPAVVGMNERDLRQLSMFLNELARGVGPQNAGAALGWSPAKVKRIMADNDVAEMIAIAEERKDEIAEQSMFELVKMRHFHATQWWLLNRRGDRWRDTKRIIVDHEHHVDGNIVVSVKRSALELLRETGVAALQPGGALDMPILDGEVIESADGD